MTRHAEARRLIAECRALLRDAWRYLHA